MPKELSSVQRLGVVLLGILAIALGGISDAYAQSASCANLYATLRQLERNGDFRAYEGQSRDLRSAQRQEQQIESRYIRQGCNDDAKARRPLSRQCRSLSDQIKQGRAEIQQMQQSVQTGEAVAQQREAVLQQIARFDCGGGSSARVTEQPTRRGNIFEQLFDVFGNDQEDIRGDDYYGYDYYGGQTVRTVCVRLSDGYYWPVSYATLPEYVANDAQQCSEQCPGAEVELFYYDNPGQEPEQMVSLSGAPYSSLPNAFRYRKEYDPNATCKAPVNYGSINIAEGAGGQSRPVITFGAETFPLPIRDPRQPATSATVQTAAVDTAQYVSVPLPRPRPAAPGEQPRPVPVAPVAAVPEERIVKFGDKNVRIVGPDTPYAPTAPAGG
jgi:hypothetical protein